LPRQSPGVERSELGPYFSNTDPVPIVQPRELSRRPNDEKFGELSTNLPEKNFIQEGFRKNPKPFIFWFVVCLAATLLVWFAMYLMSKGREEIVERYPQMQVTNRQMSLFLWQNPEFMRKNVRAKTHYLEAWKDQFGERLTVAPEEADKWVEAPYEVLFLYFVWQRLLGDYYYPRSIKQEEFLAFLKEDPEWHPRYWKEAPASYRELLAWIEGQAHYEDLKELSYRELPLVVRQAFQGWKNYTKEGNQIQKLRPTYRQLWTFLDKYPNFKRSLWINLVKEKDYLIPVQAKGTDTVPDSQMDGLLKMALYNYLSGTR
jgi:hypothetical protein